MLYLLSLIFPRLKILDKTQTGVFMISGFLVKSLRNRKLHNSRNSYDIDMNPRSARKLIKRNTTLLKNVDDDVVSANYEVNVTFLIDGKIIAIQNPDSEAMVHNFYIFMKSNLFSYKNWKQNWKISNTTLILLLLVKILFLSKMPNLYQKCLHQP